jgi:O-methyltransferase
MANQLDDSAALLTYVRDRSLREDEILRELRYETAALPGGTTMQVMAEEGQLLAFLVTLCDARTVLELGTYTGYSALWMARALPAGGRLVTCDITYRWPALGVPYWERAGVADRIDLRIGPATETLERLEAESGAGSVDLVFIDADKANYPEYYEKCLGLLRPGGLMVVDNTLFFGRVLSPDPDDADAAAVARLNETLHDDPRVDLAMLPFADGVTLVRRRPL